MIATTFMLIELTRSLLKIFRSEANDKYMGNKTSTITKAGNAGKVLNGAKTAKTVDQVSRRMSSNLHVKARSSPYPRCKLERFPVPDEKVDWSINFPDYIPIDYTSEGILKGPVYADVDICSNPSLQQSDKPAIQFNTVDGKINRESHEGKYEFEKGLPRNPRGRTGVRGRGCLGRWGPNHAADPIVTRWKTNDDGSRVQGDDGKYILQFVSVQRRDNNQWALPGGMVDAGEVVSDTLKREFGEEALNSLDMTEEQKDTMERKLEDMFKGGKEIYKGYVDDPRNTDNSWMETVALNFHDDNGTLFGQIDLNAGDDAIGVQWMDLHKDLDLYANHRDFLKKVANDHDAHW